jgi:polysaccharide biosynthesis transport protein
MRNTQTQPDDIDLASLGRAAKRSLPRVLLLSLLAGGATAGVMTTMLPRYSSTATIEIVPRIVQDVNNPGRRTDATAVNERLTKEAVNTHARNILSTNITKRVSDDLGLTRMPEFNERLDASDAFTRLLQTIGVVKSKPDQTDDDRMFAAYARSMKVAQIRDTNNILIEFTTSDPQFSATGANRLAELYRDSLMVSRKDETTDAVNRLKPEVERLTREVGIADKAVNDARMKTDTVRTQTGERTLNDVQLTELTTEFTKASGVRSEADARASAAKEQMQRGTAESNPDVQKSQIIPRLSEQRVRLERQVSELSATLMPGHPRMKQVQGDLSSLKRQIDVEVRKIVDALDRDAKIAADREKTLQAKIAQVKVRVTTSAPLDVELKSLEDTAKATRAELERVQTALKAAVSNEATGGSQVEARMVQRAIPMNEKVWPKPAFFGPLVALALMLVGLAWSVTRAIVSGPRGGASGPTGGDDRIPLQSDVLPVAKPLAAQPTFGHSAATLTAEPVVAASVASTAVAGAGTDSGAYSVAAIADALAGRAATGACRSLVTGDRPNVDAAAEAIALAKALAAAGKTVVLVDWANGGGKLADMTGGAAAPGIAQLIQGDAAFEDVLQKLADTDAHFVPAGEPLDEPTLVFDADRANLVLDALDEAYDHIVVYGAHQAAHALFESTQGRFDVGVSVSDGAAVANGAGSSFLGFEVADMATYQIERRAAASAGRRGVAPRGRASSAEARA